MKIGLVLDSSLDNNDGIQQYVIDIGEWLRSQDHDVHYLVGQSKRKDLKNIHSLSRNIKVKFNGNITTMPLPSNSHKLKTLLDKHKFDVLHIQMPYSPFMSRKIIKYANDETVIIGTFHIVADHNIAKIGNRILGYILKSSISRFNNIVSTSTASAKFALEYYNIKSDVLPCVIDYRKYSDARKLIKYDDDIINILFLGRLVPRKGCKTLIEAIAIISKSSNIPNFRVIICGKGPLEQKIRHLIKNYKLEDIVIMEGFVNEDIKPDYYATADISVFPSTGGESFGIVLLEAMASGNSIVLAGDNSGYRSVMNPYPELLFKPHDSKQLADLILKYIFNISGNKEIKIWEKQYSKNFDVNIVGNKLLGMFKSLKKES